VIFAARAALLLFLSKKSGIYCVRGKTFKKLVNLVVRERRENFNWPING